MKMRWDDGIPGVKWDQIRNLELAWRMNAARFFLNLNENQDYSFLKMFVKMIKVANDDNVSSI